MATIVEDESSQCQYHQEKFALAYTDNSTMVHTRHIMTRLAAWKYKGRKSLLRQRKKQVNVWKKKINMQFQKIQAEMFPTPAT